MPCLGLGFFQILEAETFQLRFLGTAHARLDFAIAIWIVDTTRNGDGAVVREHVAVERIERGFVNVRDAHALAQIAENKRLMNPRCAAGMHK